MDEKMTSSLSQQRRRSHRKTALIVILVLIIILIIIGIGYFSGNGSNQVIVTGTNFQINYTGSASGYLGPASQAVLSNNSLKISEGQEFFDYFTLTNRDYLLSHTINSITVDTPGFKLISIQPNVPYNLSPASSVEFTLVIQAPNSSFVGPITVVISTS
ncbi:MAG: hypothetical protein OH318_02725 [Candidatus Parvarchaeota archaeon]|nr:hypothetical protein [Candidatus Rehaiarchaeum fermentans]